jgi:hypothetical protein
MSLAFRVDPVMHPCLSFLTGGPEEAEANIYPLAMIDTFITFTVGEESWVGSVNDWVNGG